MRHPDAGGVAEEGLARLLQHLLVRLEAVVVEPEVGLAEGRQHRVVGAHEHVGRAMALGRIRK